MADGHLPEAVLAYRQALKSAPGDAGIMRMLASALEQQGRRRSAARLLEQGATAEPDDPTWASTLAGLQTAPQDGPGLKLAWIADVSSSEPIGAAVAANRAFVAYADGQLIALDTRDGTQLWEAVLAPAISSPPAADAEQVWIGTE